MNIGDALFKTAPIYVTCAGCKKKVREFRGWFDKPDSACPRCNAPFGPEQVKVAIERLRKRTEPIRAKTAYVNEVLSRTKKL